MKDKPKSKTKKQRKNYMARDQYHQWYHNLGPHPRKVLMERVGCRHAARMYVTREGKTFHIGWVIGELWLTVYEVVPMEVEVGRGR